MNENDRPTSCRTDGSAEFFAKLAWIREQGARPLMWERIPGWNASYRIVWTYTPIPMNQEDLFSHERKAQTA